MAQKISTAPPDSEKKALQDHPSTGNLLSTIVCERVLSMRYKLHEINAASDVFSGALGGILLFFLSFDELKTTRDQRFNGVNALT